MRITHNQTKPEWLVGRNKTSLGAGAFLVPDVSRTEGLPLKVEFHESMTYPECERRAEFAAAFKWIPEEEFEKVRGQTGNLSSVTCKSELCLGYCSETLCWCIGGLCKPME